MASPEESPTISVRAMRPPAESDTMVLVFSGRITRADIPRLCERIRVLLHGCDAGPVACDLGGLVDADAAVVDALARLQLIARRCGRQIRLQGISGKLEELLAVTGLTEALPQCRALPFEPKRQAEEREESRGVEEEADPGYPVT